MEARRPLLKSTYQKFPLVTRSLCFWHKKLFCTFRWQFMTRLVIVKFIAPAARPYLAYFNSKGAKIRGCDAALQLGYVTWKGLTGKRLSLENKSPAATQHSPSEEQVTCPNHSPGCPVRTFGQALKPPGTKKKKTKTKTTRSWQD